MARTSSNLTREERRAQNALRRQELGIADRSPEEKRDVIQRATSRGASSKANDGYARSTGIRTQTGAVLPSTGPRRATTNESRNQAASDIIIARDPEKTRRNTQNPTFVDSNGRRRTLNAITSRGLSHSNMRVHEESREQRAEQHMTVTARETPISRRPSLVESLSRNLVQPGQEGKNQALSPTGNTSLLENTSTSDVSRARRTVLPSEATRSTKVRSSKSVPNPSQTGTGPKPNILTGTRGRRDVLRSIVSIQRLDTSN